MDFLNISWRFAIVLSGLIALIAASNMTMRRFMVFLLPKLAPLALVVGFAFAAWVPGFMILFGECFASQCSPQFALVPFVFAGAGGLIALPFAANLIRRRTALAAAVATSDKKAWLAIGSVLVLIGLQYLLPVFYTITRYL